MNKTRDRFWMKVKPKGLCWEWQAGKFPKGYGQFQMDGGPRGAHRVSWELERGPIPDGMFVLHSCDNPSCVRPHHLFLGTQKDNVQDMLKKKRGFVQKQYGEANSQCKLTKNQVFDIRERRNGGEQLKSIADRYSVSVALISMIANNKRRTKEELR